MGERYDPERQDWTVTARDSAGAVLAVGRGMDKAQAGKLADRWARSLPGADRVEAEPATPATGPGARYGRG